jgi:hypothetical protein
MEWASGRGGDSAWVRAEGRCDGRGEADTVWRAGHDCGRELIQDETALLQRLLLSSFSFG